MIKPRVRLAGANKKAKMLQEQYVAKKLEYLELCWHYRLKPRLLSLKAISNADIGEDDRIKLIRLIIVLSFMERTLGPNEIPDHLFAADESEYLHSELFVGETH